MLARIQGPADRINIILAILVTMAINLGTFWIFATRLGTGEAKNRPAPAMSSYASSPSCSPASRFN